MALLENQTLFEKFGGMTGIAKVVDVFYDQVLADARINDFFRNTDMQKQRRHQTAFVASALGGPQYTGRSMEKAHEGMNLQPMHFDAVVENLAAALAECGVEQEDIAAVAEALAPLKDAVLFK